MTHVHHDEADTIIGDRDALNDQVAHDLRTLTRLLVTSHGAEHAGGGLGGEWGYGTHFTNTTFDMHPYNWDDCSCDHEAAETVWEDTHDHAATCYQQVIRARGYLDYDDATDMTDQSRDAHNKAITDAVCTDMGLDPQFGCAAHCTCTHNHDYAAWRDANPHDDTICAIDRPNFHHKPTGSTVTFYKYLGRGMNVNIATTSWDHIYQDCLRSLSRC